MEYVLVLNPPFHARYSRSQRSPAVIKSGVVYYPIWLAYATGVLEQDGFAAKLVDAPAAGLSLDSVLQLAGDMQPRLVVIDTSTPSIHNDVQVAAAIKQRVPGAFTLLVGPHVTAMPEESLRLDPAIDAVARGEYDYTVRDAARALAGGSDLEDVAGISYRAARGDEIVHNEARAPIEDLDVLPLVSEVYRRHLQIEDYFYSITRYPEVTIITGRGCPHRCSYCLWPQTLTGHRYRRRSVSNVADEFEFIARELPQVKEIFVEDDTLTVDRARCLALSEELVRRGNRLPFTANSRANVSYETLAALHRAGLRLVCVGFESGDQAVLDAMHKGIRVEQFHQFQADARRAGVLVHGCFMAGGPGETHESLARTLDLAKKLNPDTAQFFPLMVYPGTEAYEWAVENDYLVTHDFREWLTPEGLHRPMVNHPALTAAELMAWCDEARRSFYLRPGYIARKLWQVLAHPAEAGRILKAFRVFSRYLFRSLLPPGARNISQ
ncbi:MAG: radical SAM protein [Anaerolineae bacterium]|nr:radical SAM protein [Anaerolineae bacterium]